MKTSKFKSRIAQISIDKEENFSLMGIVCPKPIYKLAFLLNQNLNLHFTLYNDEHMEYTLPNLPLIYFSENTVDWYLFQNSFYKKKPKFKDFDYFLISYPKISEEETNNLLTKINSIDDLVISSVIELRKEIVSMFSCIL